MKPKRKVNFTIDTDILSLAKDVAEDRGRSLSALVEEFLARLASEHRKGDWLTEFYAHFLPVSYREPSNERIRKIRERVGDKYT